MQHLLAQRDLEGLGEFVHRLVEVARAAYVQHRFDDATFEKGDEPVEDGQHQRDAQHVEDRVEHRELHREIVRGDADQIADPIHSVAQGGDKQQRDKRRHRVENQVRQRQALALEVRPQRPEDRGDRRADIRPDRQGQRVLVADLPGGQGGEDQDHRGMARLHDDGRGGADERIDEQTQQSRSARNVSGRSGP